MRNIALALAPLLLAASLAHAEPFTAEGEDLQLARRAIVAELLEARDAAPAGPDTELAIALIAARDSAASVRALVELVRFRLPESEREVQDCAGLRHTAAMTAVAQDLDYAALGRLCRSEVAEMAHGSEADVPRICAGEAEMRQAVARLLAAQDDEGICPRS